MRPARQTNTKRFFRIGLIVENALVSAINHRHSCLRLRLRLRLRLCLCLRLRLRRHGSLRDSKAALGECP